MRSTPMFAALTLASALVAGCGSDSHSYVKVIHASPGAPAVDVKVGGAFATQNLSFGSASAAYLPVSADNNESYSIFAAGKDSSALLSGSQTFESNQYYTVIALNVPSSLQLKVANDDLTPPQSGDFKIRVVHGAPTAGPVDVYVTAPTTNIDDPKNPVTPVLPNFQFGTVTPYLQVPAGTYRIRVTPTGEPGTVAIDSGVAGLPIPAGGVYTAVALNPDPTKSGSTFGLLLTQDEPVPGVTPVAPAQ